jgi:propanol-preferring alcohol dehydrogenase
MRAPNADMNCIELPEGVDELAAAALGCRFMTAWRAVQSQGAVRGGETVAVFGCGGVGQAAVEIAAVLGARVIAVDVDDRKLAKMKDLGADAVVNSGGLSGEEAALKVKAITDGGVGADLAVDALGIRNTMIGALMSLRKGGRLAQVGLTSQAEQGMVALPTDLIVVNEWEIRGSLGNPQGGYRDLLAMVARGKLNPTRLVSEQVRLSDVARVLDDMDNFRTDGYVVITDFN